jgi:hypothetical protein
MGGVTNQPNASGVELLSKNHRSSGCSLLDHTGPKSGPEAGIPYVFVLRRP